MKPGYFQENWAHVFETTKETPPVIYSTITPNNHEIPMVSETVLSNSERAFSDR